MPAKILCYTPKLGAYERTFENEIKGYDKKEGAVKMAVPSFKIKEMVKGYFTLESAALSATMVTSG